MTAGPWTKYTVPGGAGQAANRDGVETPQRLLPEPLRPALGQFPLRSGPERSPRQVNRALTTNRNSMMTETMIVAFLIAP